MMHGQKNIKACVFLRCVTCLRTEGKHYGLFHCLWQVNLSVVTHWTKPS